ncbi:hypothetical protein [Mangrovibacterium diazotrophicum]|uniref:Uncharacterized protein n=1 Tax=Mangrovibacterium diazotrophicum TaxID=1261403 RepID=A0A419W837_9BACT|nr:hypothetical protein [Mangrovibacterium diazotrophicum]RKD91522.1 hypothetical protein BC643_1878 [Mangrovibacterium diazotrophicum]
MNRVSKTNLKSHSSGHHWAEEKATSAYASRHLNPVAKEKGRQEFVVDWQVGNVHTQPNKPQSKHFF